MLTKHVMSLNAKILLRFFKFILVGGFGACAYILGSYTLSSHGVKPWISSLIIYLCLVPIVYLIQKKFVFESNKSHNQLFPRYLSTQLIGLGISAFLPYILTEIWAEPIFIFICVALLNSLASYLLQLYWVFSKKQ